MWVGMPEPARPSPSGSSSRRGGFRVAGLEAAAAVAAAGAVASVFAGVQPSWGSGDPRVDEVGVWRGDATTA